MAEQGWTISPPSQQVPDQGWQITTPPKPVDPAPTPAPTAVADKGWQVSHPDPEKSGLIDKALGLLKSGGEQLGKGLGSGQPFKSTGEFIIERNRDLKERMERVGAESEQAGESLRTTGKMPKQDPSKGIQQTEIGRIASDTALGFAAPGAAKGMLERGGAKKLVPAVKTEEGVKVGKLGDNHDTVVPNAPEKDRGFVDEKGKMLDREEAAKAQPAADLNKDGKLYSEELNQSQGLPAKKEEPFTVYHGSKLATPELDPAKSDYKSGAVWFAFDPKTSQGFVGKKGSLSKVQIAPGKYFDFRKDTLPPEIANEHMVDWSTGADSTIGKEVKKGDASTMANPMLQDWLKKNGYDGWFEYERGNELSLAVTNKAKIGKPEPFSMESQTNKSDVSSQKNVSSPPNKPPSPPSEPPESIPPGPGDPKVPEIKGFVRDTEDRLYQIQKSGTADKAEMGNTLKAMPAEAKDIERQARIYDAIEAKSIDKLSPEDRDVYTKFVKPINDEEDRIYAKLRNAGVTMPREGYVHRMVQGKSPKYDPRDPGTQTDVITGGGKLPQNTGSLRDRVYLAIDDGQGGRKLIATNRQGTSVIEGGKTVPLGERLAQLKPGDEVTYNGKTYHVDQATTKEIEANTDTRYYKNALVNSVDNLLSLRRVERAVDFLEEFKKDPRFLNHAERVSGNRPPTSGYVTTRLPQMEGWRMDPKIAHALDDFYGARDAGWEWLTKANRFLTTSMFVDPVPHLHNVATHWYVARGWDNLMPQTWKRSAKNAARAVTEVMTQGRDYQRFLREGGGLLYGDVANRNFYELMLKTMGQQITKDPARWGPIVKSLGLNRPADLVAALYRASSKALWAGNDMFMLQRYYDLIEKGMPVKEAIKDAERHIPNYRIPSEVLGSRGVSVFLRSPNVFNFGRYRYGQLLSFSHMVKDIVKNDKPGARLEAIGNLMSLGILAFFVYPFADKALQAVTGNEETKARRAGPLGPVQNIIDVTTGEKDFMQALQSLIVPAPASEGIAETALNRVFFSGQRVLEPADMKRLAASVKDGDIDGMRKYLTRLGTQAVQELDTKLYPAQLIEQALKDEQPDGIRRLAERLLDVQEKTEKQVSGKKKGQIIERREAERRARKTERNLGIPQQ